MSWASTSIPPTTRWCSRSTRRAKCRPWSARSLACPSAWGTCKGSPMTTIATAPRPCLPRWTWPQGRCSISASPAIGTKSSWRSCATSTPRSPRISPYTWSSTTTGPTSTPRCAAGSPGTRATSSTSHRPTRPGSIRSSAGLRSSRSGPSAAGRLPACRSSSPRSTSSSSTTIATRAPSSGPRPRMPSWGSSSDFALLLTGQDTRPSEVELPEELAVAPRARERIRGLLLLDVAVLAVEVWNTRQELSEIDYSGAELGVSRPVGQHILHVEAPIAVPVALKIGKGIAAPHNHVADVELMAHDGWVGARDEQVVGHGAVDRRHMIGLVVEGEPDAGAPRDGAGGVEAVGPLAPVVERACAVRREVRHDEVFMAEAVRDVEASLPSDEEDGGRDVGRRRTQPFAIERGPDLRDRAPEVAERPEQFDVVVAHGAHRGEGPLGVAAHRVPYGIKLEPDTAEMARSAAAQ